MNKNCFGYNRHDTGHMATRNSRAINCTNTISSHHFAVQVAYRHHQLLLSVSSHCENQSLKCLFLKSYSWEGLVKCGSHTAGLQQRDINILLPYNLAILQNIAASTTVQYYADTAFNINLINMDRFLLPQWCDRTSGWLTFYMEVRKRNSLYFGFGLIFPLFCSAFQMSKTVM